MRHISPLKRFSVFLNISNSICHKRLKQPTLVTDPLENVHTVCPEGDSLSCPPFKAFAIDFAKFSKKADIIIGGIYLDNAKLYNSALVFQNGEFRDPHKKVYLPTYGMFDEARYFAAGEQLNHYQGKIGNFNILICEDAWHPILAYTAYSQKSLHSICISASPGRITMAGEDCSAFKNWLSRLKVYAESFSQFQYYVNLAGVEDGIYYNGETFVISPLGNEINALEKTDTYHIYEINTEDLVSAYQKGGPAQNENFTLNTHLVNQAFSRRSK